MELTFDEILILLLLAFTMIQSLWLKGSIDRNAWNDFWAKAGTSADKTPNTIDDKVVDVVEGATPFLERFGIFKDIDDKNENNPPVTLPDAEPTEIVRDLAPYARREDFAFVNDDGNQQTSLVHIPDNMMFQWDNVNAFGKRYPYPNVNMHLDYGAEYNISWIAGRGGYGILTKLHKDVTYHVVVDYTARVNSDKQPIGDWAQWKLAIIGTGGTRFDDAVHPIENGQHEVVWEIAGNGERVTVVPMLDISYASAQGDSIIQQHQIKITPLKKTA